MENAFDQDSRTLFIDIAKQLNITLPEGVYVGVLGPQYETPAEVKAYKLLGGDLVGMSTAPEVLVARHCGLKVSAFSAVTNYASGMSPEQVNHDEVLQNALLARDKIVKLWHAAVKSLV